jgi:hypothetical protein
VGSNVSQLNPDYRQAWVFFSFRQSMSRDYYNLDQKADGQHILRSYYQYGNISAGYGIAKRWVIYSDLGYFFKKVQEVRLQNGDEMIEAGGVGDLAINLQYKLFSNSNTRLNQVSVESGIKLPIGRFDERMNGVLIPVSIQPSSGAFKYSANVTTLSKKRYQSFGWSSGVFFEKSTEINRGLIRYTYGDVWMMELSGIFSGNDLFVGILSGRFEYRARDQRENSLLIESTGSRVLFIRSQIHFYILPSLQLIANCEIPVYKHVNGYQLTNLYSFKLGIAKSFKT